LQIGQRSHYQNQRIVIIQPSAGERYLSTAMWHEISTENASQKPPAALSHG
jgi:cysteine synthase A